MTPRDFCFWLQGYLELSAVDEPEPRGLTFKQVECVRRHLALVFRHEIDSSMGGPEQQTALDAAHAGTDPPPAQRHPQPWLKPDLPVMRC